MNENHLFHAILISSQLVLFFLFLLQRKLGAKFLSALFLFSAVALYTSPSRFELAYHHQSMEPGVYHDCCQPFTGSCVQIFEIYEQLFVNEVFERKEIVRKPFSIEHVENIRGPPKYFV